METPQNTLPDDLADRVAVATGEAPANPDYDNEAPGLELWPVSELGANIAGQVTGTLAAMATGWNISDTEQAMIQQPLAAIITHILPQDLTAPPNPYIALLIAAVVIAGPRVATGQPFRLPPPEPVHRPAAQNVSHGQPMNYSELAP